MEKDVVFSGNLWIPPHGKIVLRKSWQRKYCVLYKSSKFGIERLEMYDSQLRNTTPKIITLENCIKISPKLPNTVIIVTKTTMYEFATCDDELEAWVTSFQSVAFKDDSSKMTSIEESNDLYCSSGEGVFSVQLFPSEASKRCGLEPTNYTLVLTAAALQLRNYHDDRILFTWPYCFIRKYGYRNGKFTFEAGRKCETGEGIFHLKHSNQQEIFRCLATKLKSMKKIMNSEPSILDCGENQFQAALTMEARSRSPLPPSPTSSTQIHDIDKFPSSILNSVRRSSLELNRMKLKPEKPPRKSVPASTSISNDTVYEPVDNIQMKPTPLVNYDQVDVRTEAWRTLGISDVKHSEADCDEQTEYMSWTGRRDSEPDKPSAKIIITQPKGDEESYDNLNFFGPANKSVQSGYKQVTPAPVKPSAMPSWNEYDEVEINMQAVRLADDSHLGYGMIRKIVPVNKESVLHEVHADNVYAIVSKPKKE